MTPDELREKVARAMWAKPLDEGCEPVPWEDATDEARNAYLMEADAAIAVVLEEAAQVAEAEKFGFENLTPYGEGRNQTCDLIAAAIRAMKKD